MMNEQKPDRWFENVTLSDLKVGEVSIDEGGTLRKCSRVSEILGHDSAKVVYKDLRAICCKLGVSGYKNKKKDVLLELMAAKKTNEAVYDQMFKPDNGKTMTRKEIQCPFRLLNIVFSDAYAERLARIGDAATRSELDSGKLKEESFWSDVQATFVDESVDENISNLQFKHPAFKDMNIDPSKIVQHDWKKLQSIFKATNSAYKSCLANFRVSGTHTSDFYSFCNGKLDVLYLHLHLQTKPGLNEAIEADLPKGVFMESEGENAYVASPPPLKKKRPRENAEVLKNILNSPMMCESNAQRNKLVEKRNEMIWRQTELKEMEGRRQEEQEKRKKVLDHLKVVRQKTKLLKQFSQMSDRLSALEEKLKKEKDERKLELLTQQINVQQEYMTDLLKSDLLDIKQTKVT